MAKIGCNLEKALSIISSHGTITKNELKELLLHWKERINANKVIKELIDGGLVNDSTGVLSCVPGMTSSSSPCSITGLPSSWSYSKNGGYKIKPFSPVALSEDDAAKFFIYTMRYYLKLFRTPLPCKPGIVLPTGFTAPKMYLSPTDKLLLDPTSSLSADSFVFKQMIFHSQNGTGKIDFLANEVRIRTYLCSYDINAFYRYISGKTIATEAPIIQRSIGASSDQATQFFKTAKSIITYLHTKKTSLRPGVSLHDSIKEDFITFMTTYDYLRIYETMKNPPISIYGLGEALTFDFLKEFDRCFDLPKPDLHVKRTLVSLFHNDRTNIKKLSHRPTLVNPESIKTLRGTNNCMELYLNLMEFVNRGITGYIPASALPITIRNYILDKMIYMICSGKLYLHISTVSSFTKLRHDYRAGILNDDYKTITITPGDIVELRNLI